MSLKQYTSLIRLGDMIFFRALIAQTLLLGVLGLAVLLGKIYLDRLANEKTINNSLKKWESVITEAVYIQQTVSDKEMPQIHHLKSFQDELKSYGVTADVEIITCGTKSDEIALYIGKKKLKNCLFIIQDNSYVYRVFFGGALLVFLSMGVSLIVWKRAKKNMEKQFYNPLIVSITEEVNKLQDSENDRIRNEAMTNLATQVAHDIRSPLEVLKSLKNEISNLPDTTKKNVQLCINRIEEITFNLLRTHKLNSVLGSEAHSEDLQSLINGVVIEKKMEFRHFSYVEIVESMDLSSYGLFSKFPRNALKSIISNLVNNSVEALNDTKGTVKLSLYSDHDKNIIKVSDNGRGFFTGAEEKLFSKGFTTKKTGNGLGLFNAKKDIEAFGGTISCMSAVGKGTTFIISLPKSDTPETFVSSLDTTKYDRIIILDDDPAFHEVWNKRLIGLESKVEHIFSVEEMLSKYQALNSKILLLSDFELMDKNYDGIDTILKLNHAIHSILVTARNEERAIQDRCLQNGIKLLPKSLVNYVKVVSTVRPVSDMLVLIDDDKLVRMNWASHCKKNSIPFLDFISIEAFLAASKDIGKDARICVDSNLGDGIKGEIESEKIFLLGFDNLYLVTGYEKDSIKKPTWIKEIYSKAPDRLDQ